MHYITDYMLVVGIAVLLAIAFVLAREWFKKEFPQTPSQIAEEQAQKLSAKNNKYFERIKRGIFN